MQLYKQVNKIVWREFPCVNQKMKLAFYIIVIAYLIHSSVCVECTSNSDCSGEPINNICLPGPQVCVECRFDFHCSSSAHGEFCVNNQCVECKNDKNCRNDTTCDSICSDGICEYGNLTCSLCNVDVGK